MKEDERKIRRRMNDLRTFFHEGLWTFWKMNRIFSIASNFYMSFVRSLF